MAMLWYYTQNGQQASTPVPVEGLRSLVASGVLRPMDMVWREGLPTWVQARQIRGLFPENAPAPQPTPSWEGNLAFSPQQSPYNGAPAMGQNQRPRRPRDEYEDYKDPNDRPRRRRVQKSGSGSKLAGVIAIVVGGLLVLGLIIGGVILVVNAGSDTQRAMEFNDRITKSQYRIVKVGKEFEKLLQPALLGQPLDVPQLKNKHNELKLAVAHYKSELNAVAVPAKPSAQKFLGECKKCASLADEMLSEMAKWFAAAESQPPDGLKLQQIGANLMAIESRGKQLDQSMQNAQKVFANDYNLKLLPPPTF